MKEGPRGLRKGELESLRAMTSIVFRPSLVDEYPQLFKEENFENLRVCLEDGKCVSHVGMTERGAALFGCRIQVCCIGAVSTHPDYRGQGLASACFDAAVQKAYDDGVDVMLVSGSRSLYQMRGCLRVGHDSAFTMTPESATTVQKAAGVEVTVGKMKDEELSLVMDCYRREPVRFIRPLDDYHNALQCGMVMNRYSDFLVVRERGEFRGYVILQQPHDRALQPLPEKKTDLAEFAGDRRALVAALPEIVRNYALVELHWQVQRHDDLFRSLCTGAGLAPRSAAASGTVKLINFPQLMERMRPRFEELLGKGETARLAFWQRDEEYGFRLGDDEFVTDRDSATRLVFGTADGAEWQVVEGRGRLAEVLRTIFPLPCLWYGLNYA
jgi:predicted N-acetyltransferase YhbS